MPSEQTPSRPFFWFGITLLTLTMGIFLLGFLAAVSWGAILFPVLGLMCISPLIAIAWFRQLKPGDFKAVGKSFQRFGFANVIAVCVAVGLSVAFWVVAYSLLIADEKVDNGPWLVPQKRSRTIDSSSP